MDDKTRTTIMLIAIKFPEKGQSAEQIMANILPHVSSAASVAKCEVEMHKSLREGVYCRTIEVLLDEVGGAGWDIDEFCEMTVMDLISHLATNKKMDLSFKQRKENKNDDALRDTL